MDQLCGDTCQSTWHSQTFFEQHLDSEELNLPDQLRRSEQQVFSEELYCTEQLMYTELLRRSEQLRRSELHLVQIIYIRIIKRTTVH